MTQDPGPIVKYRTNKIMGIDIRYKETLLTTITGPLAKIFIEAHNRHEELIWDYDFENQKIDLYRSDMIDAVEE